MKIRTSRRPTRHDGHRAIEEQASDRSGREPYLESNHVDRQRSLVERHSEFRVAEVCARLKTLRRTSRQGAKCLPKHQLDMDPRRILHFVCESLRILTHPNY
jgi:hypothetical protein